MTELMATAVDPGDSVKAFEMVPGDRGSEVGHTLAAPVPRALGLLDQLGLWGNLGVSLLGFTGAIFVLQPGGPGTPKMSLLAALVAIIVGTLIGTVPIALAGLPGTRTGAPAMVLLRGLFGARLSRLPTALNVMQCFGWGIFELVTIATAAHVLAPGVPRWGYVLIAGALTTLLAVRPLGFIRTLRRYVTAAVVCDLIYLLGEVLSHPLPGLTVGGWSGFWAGVDTVCAAAISFAPLAADYARHSRGGASAVVATIAGYGSTQVLCYAIGLLALVGVAQHGHLYGAFIALPLGTLAFAVLAARELDQSFANVYSTAVSVQNIRPLWDRRVLAVVIGALATAGALVLNIASYENFLDLLGSVFVPLSAVLACDYFVVSRGRWDLSERSHGRPMTVLAWAVGFVAYQLINPGYVSWWVSGWTWVDRAIDFTPSAWMSASIMSFLVAAVATLIGAIPGRLRTHVGVRRGVRSSAGARGSRVSRGSRSGAR
jgi:NCS1 family nucleobase:cation symporter-1